MVSFLKRHITKRKPRLAEVVVEATWDPDARVWVATSEDVPGLATEAETTEALLEKLKVIIPELMELNGLIQPDGAHSVPLHLVSSRYESVIVS